MEIRKFLRILRSQWIVVCVTTIIAIAGAVAVTLLTTPLYQSSTTLFVSTTSTTSDVSDIYQGNLFSQERVTSYTQLLMGETLAQRTVDKLHLDISAKELQQKVKASSPKDTVLIDVSVVDPSPVKARAIVDTLSDEFVGMVSELETPKDGVTPNARVIVEQHGSISSTPVIPDPPRNIAIGIIVGLVLGIGLAFLRDRMDNTVKSREILEGITGSGLVGNIPFDKDRRRDPAISFPTDRSVIAEAFRTFRTNLQFLDVDNPPRVLIVTSALPGDGKTTTAMNLALALTEAEHNVVLVDGDMRRPKVHDYLDLVGSVGFSTVLTGRASLDEVLQKTRFPGLTVLTAGTVPPNPSELLGSMAAQKVMDELRTAFDYVIVDSSPLLAVTDAAVLAAHSDGVLVMARFAETKREQLAHAVKNLENVGARILGAVFTMTPPRGNESYYYYYNYYGHVDGKPSSSPAPPPPNEKSGRRRRDRRPDRDGVHVAD